MKGVEGVFAARIRIVVNKDVTNVVQLMLKNVPKPAFGTIDAA